MATAPARKCICRVRCGRVELKLTLSEKLLVKPLTAAVLTPFLGAYNKKVGGVVTVDTLVAVTIDGIAVEDFSVRAGEALPEETHKLELTLRAEGDSETVALDLGDGAPTSNGASSPDAVTRVCDAPHEFAVLELPVEPASQTVVRKAYRRISLQVHPDKVPHPRATEAFRKAFNAMKLLMEPARQRERLKEIETGVRGEGVGVPSEMRWWDAATVDQMSQAFHNLEDYLEAQGAFGAGAIEDHLWVDAAEGERLRQRGLAFFIDSRDTRDYDVSHVHDALSLPGHTMEQLEGLLQHPTVLALARSPASIVVVYSDNGSKLSRCTNVRRQRPPSRPSTCWCRRASPCVVAAADCRR